MILAILQARMSSSRLPGKVMELILSEPMLFRQIERIKRATLIDKLLIATSVDPADDIIYDFCQKNSVDCFRGSLNDVLDRFYHAAKLYNPNYVVRFTADCPLIDFELIDEVIRFTISGNYDYASNALKPTYPDGLDVEVIRFNCLLEAHQYAVTKLEREHVTSYLIKKPNFYSLGSYENGINLSHLRWTVDESEDLILVSKIYKALYPGNKAFLTQDILNFLNKNPNLLKLNSHYKRNQGRV